MDKVRVKGADHNPWLDPNRGSTDLPTVAISIKMLHCNKYYHPLPMSLEQPSPVAVDPEKMAETMADVIARSQRIAAEFMTNQSGHLAGSFDPVHLGEQFLKNMAQFSFDPQALMEAQAEFWQGSLALWQQTADRKSVV